MSAQSEEVRLLEVVLHADGERLQRRPGEAASTDTDRPSVVAIRGDAVAARAEVVVRAVVVDLARVNGVPVGLLVKMVLVAEGIHIGLVVDRPSREGAIRAIGPDVA